MIGASLELAGKTVRMGRRGYLATREQRAQRAVQEAMACQVFKGCEDSQVLQVQWDEKGKKETRDWLECQDHRE